MTRSNATRALALVAALSLSSALAKGNGREMDSTASTSAKGNTKSTVQHTITWWCVDFNEVWKVNEPVITGFANLNGDGTGPCAGTTPFPVRVAPGQTFMPGGAFIWGTNKTYSTPYAAAVAAQGFTFAPASNSPSEDFKRKMSQVRIEVFTFPDFDPVAVFTFDAQQSFKLVQLGDFNGTLGQNLPIDDPALDIHLSADEVDRLPTYGFTVKAGPVPPGQYWACVTWVLSGDHWDGIGVDPNANLLQAGDFFYGCNRFQVVP